VFFPGQAGDFINMHMNLYVTDTDVETTSNQNQTGVTYRTISYDDSNQMFHHMDEPVCQILIRNKAYPDYSISVDCPNNCAGDSSFFVVQGTNDPTQYPTGYAVLWLRILGDTITVTCKPMFWGVLDPDPKHVKTFQVYLQQNQVEIILQDDGNESFTNPPQINYSTGNWYQGTAPAVSN